jgi:2-oxo-4-hydroxy-4-carboxy-5-ureidoimidazoline decarboxylase
VNLTEFNLASDEAVRPVLLACCDVESWATAVAEGRPYARVDDALDGADKAARTFSPDDVASALAAHPRIGERAEGRSTEASWSRQEQATVSRDEATQASLVEGNRAYEDRFGRVFLICATGLSGEQILASLKERLANDDATEEAVVGDELRKIAVLRLRKVLEA